jgi:ADP-ribose pyrophosphatase YjhB (NUDIX family)
MSHEDTEKNNVSTIVEPNHPLEEFHFCPRCGSAHFTVNDEKSKRCADCGFVYYFNPSAATAAFITNDEGKLLVCRRAKEPARGTLDLPGGFCDLHETMEEGVAREIKEETGLTVDETQFLFTLPDRYLYSDFLVHTVDGFFRCKVHNFTHISARDDAAELMWIPIEQLRVEDFGLESIRRAVQKILDEHRL